MIAIFNAHGNRVFKADFDSENCVQESLIGGQMVSCVFNPYQRSTSVKTRDGYSYEKQFDPKHRLKKIKDSLGKWIQFTYDDGQIKKNSGEQ